MKTTEATMSVIPTNSKLVGNSLKNKMPTKIVKTISSDNMIDPMYRSKFLKPKIVKYSADKAIAINAKRLMRVRDVR